MSQKRQPAGIPVGGQFSANEHDEAAALAGVPNDDSHLNVEDLNEGDIIDLTRNVLEIIERDPDAGVETFLGRHEITSIVYDEDLGLVRLGFRNPHGREDFWNVVEEEDTFDRVQPIEADDIINAEDLAPRDLIDMTRTVDEYLTDPNRGGNEGLEGIKDIIPMRGLYRVVSTEEEGDGDYTVMLRSESHPFADDVSWFAMKDVSTFDFISDRAEGISRDLLDPNGGESAILRDFPDAWRSEARTAIRAAIQYDEGGSATLIANRMMAPGGDKEAILRDLPDRYKPEAHKAIIAAIHMARKS